MLNYLLTLPSCNASPFPYDNDGASVYIVLLHSILHAVPVAVGKPYSSVQKSPANTVTARYRSVVNQGMSMLITSILEAVCTMKYVRIYTLINYLMYPVHTLFVHVFLYTFRSF